MGGAQQDNAPAPTPQPAAPAVGEAGIAQTSNRPGIYAIDYAGIYTNPTDFPFVGTHQSFKWNTLEPVEGVPNWTSLDSFVRTRAARNVPVSLHISFYDGRSTNPPSSVPDWVYTAVPSAGINCTAGGVTIKIPKYWDTGFLTKYENFIRRLAEHIRSDPELNGNIEFIYIGVGRQGETQPVDPNWPEDKTCMQSAGLTSAVWVDTVKKIVDIYKRQFKDNGMPQKLLLPNAPKFLADWERQEFSLYAIQNGFGLVPAGVRADLDAVDARRKAGWHGYYKYDYLLDQADDMEGRAKPTPAPAYTPFPVAQEAYEYMTGSPEELWWGVYGALSRHDDYLTVERTLLYEGTPHPNPTPLWQYQPPLRFANKYLGKTLANTPGVWVVMRESDCPDSYNTQVGNYDFWLQQDGSVAGGSTQAVTSRTTPYTYVYCYTTGAYNPSVLWGQTQLLGPSGEQWMESLVCRRTKVDTGNTRMYFRVNDGWPHTAQVTIRVRYFDLGYDTWTLWYDSTTGMKQAPTVTKTNSRTWLWATFSLSDARLANNGPSGTDFYIDAGSGDEYIHMVEVTKAGGVDPTPTNTPTYTPGASPTPSPTQTPGASPTPTQTPTNTPTPTATSTPTRTPERTPVQPGSVTLKQGVNPTGYAGCDDVEIKLASPTTGVNDSWLRIKSDGSQRALIKFDLTGHVPLGATISSATLRLKCKYVSAANPMTVATYGMVRPWEEASACWVGPTGTTAWAAPDGGAGDTGPVGDRKPDALDSVSLPTTALGHWYSWNVTRQVQDWADNPATNKGLLLMATSGQNVYYAFASSEDSANDRPELVITWSGGHETPTPTPGPARADAILRCGAPGCADVQDTFLLEAATPQPQQLQSYMALKGIGSHVPLLRFSLDPVPPGVLVQTATLQLYLYSSSHTDPSAHWAITTGAHGVRREWQQTSATWLYPWQVPGAKGDQDRDTLATDAIPIEHDWINRWHQWNVSDLVRDWYNGARPNYGLLLSADGGEGVWTPGVFNFYSSNASASNWQRPRLRVIYDLATPTPTATPTPMATPTATATPTRTATPTATTPPRYGTLRVTVFNDLNGNGERDSGEPGLPGAMIEVLQEGEVLRQGLTGANGQYTVTSLLVGVYSVRETNPPGYASRTPDLEESVYVAPDAMTDVFFADYPGPTPTPSPTRIIVYTTHQYLPLLQK